MKLTSLTYSEHVGDPREWKLRRAIFKDTNLIVGRNASGKTRFLNVISALASLISGAQQKLFESGSYRAEFVGEDADAVYELELRDLRVERERYVVNGSTMLERSRKGKSEIKALELGQTMLFDPPDEQLAVVARRDAIQHPYLQQLYEWATSVKLYRFGTDMGAHQLTIELPSGTESDRPKKESTGIDHNNLYMVYKDGLKKFGPAFNKHVIASLRQFDYNVQEIGIDSLKRAEFQGSPVPPNFIFVKEKDLKCRIPQHFMSSGMFRALNLAIQTNYWVSDRHPGLHAD